MNQTEKKELVGQIISGLIYGLAAVIAANASPLRSLVILIAVTGLKVGVHQFIRHIQPRTIREGKVFERVHWTEKAEKIL